MYVQERYGFVCPVLSSGWSKIGGIYGGVSWTVAHLLSIWPFGNRISMCRTEYVFRKSNRRYFKTSVIRALRQGLLFNVGVISCVSQKIFMILFAFILMILLAFMFIILLAFMYAFFEKFPRMPPYLNLFGTFFLLHVDFYISFTYLPFRTFFHDCACKKNNLINRILFIFRKIVWY